MMTPKYEVGEIALLCNFPAHLSRLNGREVTITGPLFCRDGIYGHFTDLPAGEVFPLYPLEAIVAVDLDHLRKRKPPDDLLARIRSAECPDWRPAATTVPGDVENA